MIFIRSHRKNIARSSSSSVTVSMSSTYSSTSGNVSLPSEVVRAPSAIVSGTGITFRVFVLKDWVASSPAAGSTPSTLQPRSMCRAAIAQPDSSPAPPQGTSR